MRSNVRRNVPAPVTHEGGRAERHVPILDALTRSVATCLLWEDTFYEGGTSLAARIEALAAMAKPEEVAALAIRARNDFKLRHAPLWLLRSLVRSKAGAIVRSTMEQVIQRPDELAEFLTLYWTKIEDGKRAVKRTPLAAQVKRGLAAAFRKFDRYQLAKWNRLDRAVKLRDVLFLCHAKPNDAEQAELWKALVDGNLAPPDTWEVALSAGADKKATWERLLETRKLGYIALLMNLRNMEQAGVTYALVAQALAAGAKKSRALPFRFVTAAEHAPRYAEELSMAMVSSCEEMPKLQGATAVLVDISGSMDHPVSGRSKLVRWKAAAALGVLVREVCAEARIFAFSDSCVEVRNLRGLALIDAVTHARPHGGTNLGAAVVHVLQKSGPTLRRLIVLTDEQSHDALPQIIGADFHGYIVNVASYENGVDTSGGNWQRINGFSERILDWVRFEESGGVPPTVEVADTE